MLRPSLSEAATTERDLEAQMPKVIQGLHMIPSATNPEQSYRMPESTYDSLQPLGIVSRVFEGGKKRFDAVLIAGDNADAFHDQRACFTAQDWTVLEEKVVTVDLDRGAAEAVQIEVEREGQKALALFAFRGPSGKVGADFQAMWLDFLWSEVKTGRVQEGQFFRVIALHPHSTEDELRGFAAEFIDKTVQQIEADLEERDE
jgi:hypothetical protein